jgi:hypothetical protein
MKNICGLLAAGLLLFTHSSNGQLVTMPGSFVTADTTSMIVLNNIGVTNHATAAKFDNVFRLTGDAEIKLGGNEPMRFNKIVLEKSANAKLLLNQDITVEKSLSFDGGIIDLNGKTIKLEPQAALVNENKSSRIIGPHGGYVSIHTTITSAAANPGNLGAAISCSTMIGDVTVKRGHQAQTGISMDRSIERYYDIEFANNNLNQVRLSFDHFDAELNGQEEARIKIYNSDDRGIHWKELTNVMRNTVLAFELQGNAKTTHRWTLATPEPLKLQGASSIGTLRTWPNPAGNYFFVEAQADGDANIQVFDVTGKLFGSYAVKKGSTIKVENLSPGIYIIKADGKNLNASNRVIVASKNTNQPGLMKIPSNKKLN